ncbi:MAG: hypothetical protein ACRCYO_18625 [Bacteroidia bacterium]
MNDKKKKAAATLHVLIDPTLERFQNQVLSPEKLDQANRVIAIAGLPKK